MRSSTKPRNRAEAAASEFAHDWIAHDRRVRSADARRCAYDWLLAPPGVRPPDWSPATAADRVKAAIADGGATVLVADDNETLVGFATVDLDIVSVRFGQRAWVEDLAVAHRRSSGIGKALLDAAKTWARDHGPLGSRWSPERRVSMPIASMSASVQRAGPGRSDGFCSTATRCGRAAAGRWATPPPRPDPSTRACARPLRPRRRVPAPARRRAVPSSPPLPCQPRSRRTRPHATG